MVLSPVEADRRFPQFASLPPEFSTTPMTLAAVFGTQPWLDLVGDDEHLHRYELLALVDARDRQVEAGGLEALLVNEQMRAAACCSPTGPSSRSQETRSGSSWRRVGSRWSSRTNPRTSVASTS